MTMAVQSLTSCKSSLLWICVSGALVLTFYFLFHEILMPFVVAMIIAYILKPIVEKLASFNISRGTSALLLVIGFLFFIVTILIFALPFIKNELLFFAKKLPEHLQGLQQKLNPYLTLILSYVDENYTEKMQSMVTEYFSNAFSWALRILAGIFSSTLVIANALSLIIITPFIIFYLLRDWPKVEKSFAEIVPLARRATYHSLGKEIQETLAAYFRGQALVCLFLSGYYIIGLSLVGLNFSVTIGFISGILVFIPYIGFLIAFLSALGVSLVQFASLKGVLFVVVIYGFGQFLEAFFLTPKLIGGRIGLHPAWIIFALLAGGVLAGFSGIILAVPIAAVLKVLFSFLLKAYRKSPAFLGRP